MAKMKVTLRHYDSSTDDVTDDFFDIRFGQYPEGMRVSVHDGKVRIEADRPIFIQPAAGNSVYIVVEPSRRRGLSD